MESLNPTTLLTISFQIQMYQWNSKKEHGFLNSLYYNMYVYYLYLKINFTFYASLFLSSLNVHPFCNTFIGTFDLDCFIM